MKRYQKLAKHFKILQYKMKTIGKKKIARFYSCVADRSTYTIHSHTKNTSTKVNGGNTHTHTHVFVSKENSSKRRAGRQASKKRPSLLSLNYWMIAPLRPEILIGIIFNCKWMFGRARKTKQNKDHAYHFSTRGKYLLKLNCIKF